MKDCHSEKLLVLIWSYEIMDSWQLYALCTCRNLLEVTVGTHFSNLVLQQPEHLCTSTQGGHSMKLALRRSSMDLVTSITSVRTLQAACWAGCASTVRGRRETDRLKENKGEFLVRMTKKWRKTEIHRKGHKYIRKPTKTSSVSAVGVVCVNIMLVFFLFYRKRWGRRGNRKGEKWRERNTISKLITEYFLPKWNCPTLTQHFF